ncbi:MKI67 FHA domain-interacting nucleolar phosphoprotein [Gadus morhua]|uniref:RRM domain-containing protein n=1 Tax=Gadus morhua TaxID=8049 RepID=A0A8C4Z0G5_GADMO|nr:MKI67 FHA domain-interacting nucleolar phosphoprotein [Gadus morhua]
MTEGGKAATAKAPKELLALNPEEESAFRKKVRAVKKRPKQFSGLSPGVVYVAHLPRSLGEKELKIYFQQFGKILRLRLSRSKKTGGSKGYAFIEYECDEVAKIVAETMNNYLMRERLIKCQLIAPEKVHMSLFSGSERKFKDPIFPAVKRYNMVHTEDGIAKMTGKLLRKESKLRKRLSAKGIDYEFPGFFSQVPKKERSENADVSTCSDITPLCTPSVLERRKSQIQPNNDTDEEDEEVTVKLPLGDEYEEDISEEEMDKILETKKPSEGDEADYVPPPPPPPTTIRAWTPTWSPCVN